MYKEIFKNGIDDAALDKAAEYAMKIIEGKIENILFRTELDEACKYFKSDCLWKGLYKRPKYITKEHKRQSLFISDEIGHFDFYNWKREYLNFPLPETVKTSREWYRLDDSGVIIMDPDGWDRTKYDYSFNEELITEEEYKKRKLMSTCLFKFKK